MTSLYQAACYHAVRRPAKVALMDQERSVSFADFVGMVRRVAAMVAARGVGRGDRVMGVLENSIEYVALIHASALGGFIVVPVNFRCSPDELSYFVADCQPALVLYQSEYAELVETLVPAGVRHNVEEAGWMGTAVPDLDRDARRFGTVAADDVSLIIYTSGTTSRPKGAMLTHGNLVWNSINNVIELELTHRCISVMTTPLFHISGLGVLNGPVLYAGGTVYVMPRFSADELRQVLEALRPTNLSLLSVMWAQFLDRCDDGCTTYPEVQAIQTAAAPLSTEQQSRIRRLFPNAEWGWGFGMTESCVTTIRSRSTEELTGRPGAIGYPWRHVQFRLRDDEGREVLAPEAIGELEVRGPTVFAGYWQQPEATAAVLSADGWLRTGDLFRCDEGEFMTFVGRSKDMIKSGGENIAALEVESCLLEHPAVKEAAAFGVAHDTWGEMLVVAVVSVPGQEPTEADLIAFCRRKLSRFKVPKHVVHAQSLPRSTSGKVQKFRLAELNAHLGRELQETLSKEDRSHS